MGTTLGSTPQSASDAGPVERRRPGPTALRWSGMVAALLFLAGAVGYVVGHGRPPSRDSVDVGFLYDMIVHHEQAQTLANLELANGEEPGVELFAREILLFQSYDIGRMHAQLERWNYRLADRPARAMEWMGMPVQPVDMPGMAIEDEVDALRRAQGRRADALFLRLMQDHHAGGEHMAAYAADHADDPRCGSWPRASPAASDWRSASWKPPGSATDSLGTPPGTSRDRPSPAAPRRWRGGPHRPAAPGGGRDAVAAGR
jgi:uncharacterized protein (DUF305 family)